MKNSFYVFHISFYLITFALTFIFHIIIEGAYVSHGERGSSTYWIGAVGTTIPFFILLFIGLVHSIVSQKQPLGSWPCFCGYASAWGVMTLFTIYILLTTKPFFENSSTMAIAVCFTPVVYFLIMPIPYFIGHTMCMLFMKSPKDKMRK